MGDMGPRGAINMGGRDLKYRLLSLTCHFLGNYTCYLWYVSNKNLEPTFVSGEISYIY